ncbi:MAG: LysE family translocator [Candidatus Babeliales bacterium]
MVEYGIIGSKGLFVGFVLAMMLGPIGIFCIQQTLRKGFKAGFAAGLGAAVADGIYGMIGGFGLTYISDFLLNYHLILHIIGGTFLAFLGFNTFMRKESPVNITVERPNLLGLFSTTFFLTLANPITILAFTALLASIDIEVDGCCIPMAIILFTSIFIGSTLWWFFLASIISTFRTKLSLNFIRQLNMLAGIVIHVFGLLIVAKALYKLLV